MSAFRRTVEVSTPGGSDRPALHERYLRERGRETHERTAGSRRCFRTSRQRAHGGDVQAARQVERSRPGRQRPRPSNANAPRRASRETLRPARSRSPRTRPCDSAGPRAARIPAPSRRARTPRETDRAPGDPGVDAAHERGRRWPSCPRRSSPTRRRCRRDTGCAGHRIALDEIGAEHLRQPALDRAAPRSI